MRSLSNNWRGRGVAIVLSALLPVFPVFSAVLVSIKPIGFIASAITEGVTTTEVLLPNGASPHEYALKPSDVKKLNEAELVIWIGSELEAFLSKSLQQSSIKQLELSKLTTIESLLAKRNSDEHDEHSEEKPTHVHAGEYDMHIWLSPVAAKYIADAIHEQLLALYPARKAQLDQNLQKFELQLQQLDSNVVKMLKPLKGKGYFVFHDAYGYFENHFGLQQLGYFTMNPQVQPGAQRLNQIRTALLEHKAVCVFAEPQFRSTLINSVSQGTNVRVGTLDPLGSNIALGQASYIQFLSQLAEQFTHCLGGE